MKERNGRGQFRATETLAYKKKMKNHFGQFDNVSQEAYMEAATEKYDFSTCQRPDGSKYGSPGRCVKGTETSPASKDDKKSGTKASSGGGGGSSSKGKDIATAPAPPKSAMTKKDPVKSVLNEQQKTKDFLKKDNAKMGKENPKLAMDTLKSKSKKLSDEYERLRGDKSPEATKRRAKIMDDFNKNFNKQKDLQKKVDDAAKSQSPKAPRDSSPAGAQRRANAAARARD